MPTLADVRKIALSLDGVTEIDHFARPAWRTTKRIFAVMRKDGLWLHLPDERKDFLFGADGETFVKYMWGKRAEILVQIDRVSKKELAALLREAWENCMPAEKAAKPRPAAGFSRSAARARKH